MLEKSIPPDSPEDALQGLNAGNVLDVATGSGGFIGFLLDNVNSYHEITGIDNSERALEAARQAHPGENILFRRMDAAWLDFPDAHFDTVSIANSLHHMANMERVLSEMKRVCKPGGHFIISEMFQDEQDEAQLTHVYLHHWWAAVDRADGITHDETFTRQQLLGITGSLGLRYTRYFELNDPDSDPKDPELIKHLDGIVDRFIQRAEKLEGGSTLVERGEELRRRLHEVGFRGATALFMLAEK